MASRIKKISSPENILFSSEISSEIFWILFRSNNFGVALSDDNGDISIANCEFKRQLLMDDNYPAISRIVSSSGKGISSTKNLTVFIKQADNSSLKLHRICLHNNSNEGSYLWITLIDSQYLHEPKIAFVKNLHQSFSGNSFELTFRSSSEDNILFANRLFNNTFGFTSNKEAKGFLVQQLFDNADDYAELKKNILVSGEIDNKKITCRTRQGDLVIVLANCRLHNDENDVKVFNWTMLNITRQEEFERSLQLKNNELAKLNLQMERFLYSASHDLRSPLTSIMGLVNLIRLETQSSMILDYVGKIEISTTRLDKIIKDIMSFSKTTYQRSKSDRIDLQVLIWKIINQYGVEPCFRMIAFDVKVEGSSKFYSDTDRVEIVLDNLIRNAIHFYDPNKLNSFIRIYVKLENEEAIISVIDNGLGISKQHIDNIFNMFYKASINSKGAGLGLYIVKESLVHLKGKIEVESEVGFGSIFTLVIPNGPKGKLISRKQMLLAASEM